MVAMMIAVAALTAQDPSTHHVRSSDPKVVALFNTGMSRSETFRRLVDILDRSDVVVYVEPKTTRQALGGFLAHNVVVAGAYRYVHIAVEVQGAPGRLVPLLAHELQHAVEVAQNPEARDAKSLDALFDRLSVTFGCGGTTCSETQAAKDVEATVTAELKTTPGILLGGSPCSAGQVSTPIRRVRSSDRMLVDLIGLAAQQSKTFDELLASVETTNGIVYVEPGKCSHGVHACLQFWMKVSGPNRFMRILIDRSMHHADIETMSSIGHELQHATEVLREPTIRDGVTMFNFFKQIAPTDNNRFETTAAVDAGDAVYDELRESSRNSR